MSTLAQALNLAISYQRAGNLQQAELLCRQNLQVDPQHGDSWHLLGLIAVGVGRFDLASEYIRQALRFEPDCAEAHCDLGSILLDQGRVEEATACYQEALRLKPDYAMAHTNLGYVLWQQGKKEEAVACYRQAINADPNFAGSHNNLGLAYQEAGELEDAAASYRQALQLNSDFVEAHHNLGNVLMELGKAEQAEASYRQALRLRPGTARTQCNLGAALLEQGKLAEAADSLRHALRLQPDFVDAFTTLGKTLDKQDQLDEAAANLQQALRLQPHNAEAHNIFGVVLGHQGKFEEAIANFQEALYQKPDYAWAHYNLAAHWLMLGNYERGWSEYEWRWKTKALPLPPVSQPRWDGGPLDGKTILLYAEQGLGDTLQFIRYAAPVKQRGATVVVACQPPLIGILAGCAGVDQLLPQGLPLPACDVQAPLLSLPGLCGTTLTTVPAQVPYLFADRSLVEVWRDRLAAAPGFKVGICWQGSQVNTNDRRRSVLLTQFAPLTDIPGVRLVSLQIGPGSEQLTALAESWAIMELPGRTEEPVQAWADSAALLCALDLVITVDTAVVHLAGALDVPVWVALPFFPDWRWLTAREDSPWYPSVRLFRQSQPGGWAEVFARIRDALRAHLGHD